MDELEALKVRDEVLQALYWMRSEGLAERASSAELARFLAVPAATLAPYLERFVEDGLLERAEPGLEPGSPLMRRARYDGDFARRVLESGS